MRLTVGPVTVSLMSDREALERVDQLASLLTFAVDLLRGLRSDILRPDDYRLGQIEQWLWEAEEALR